VIGGKYRVLGTLGRGGYGTVYRAEQSALGRAVAVKVLDPAFAAHDDPKVVQRFLREAAAAARLQHPNIVNVHDFGQEGEQLYLVMELLDGRTLNALIKQHGALPAVRVLHIAKQLCKALREAHKRCLIHRDIKPSNVLLVDRDEDPDFVKVLDFGLVLDESSTDELTKEGRFVGTPRYMSPEHFGQGGADARSDIYSVGVLMYRMLSGEVPFDGPPVAILSGHLHKVPAPPSERGPAPYVPPRLEAAVMRCLEKRPEDRFQSIADLLYELRQAHADLTGDGPSVSEALEVTPSQVVAAEVIAPARRGRTTPWLILLAPVLVGAVAVAVLLTASPREPRVVVHAREPDQRVIEPVPAPLPARPQALRIEIDSVPTGAEVWAGDEKLGVTPLRDTWRRSPAELSAPHELQLRLKGHRTRDVTLTPADGVLRGQVKLQRKVRRKAKPPRPPAAPAPKPDGYKEDPY